MLTKFKDLPTDPFMDMIDFDVTTLPPPKQPEGTETKSRFSGLGSGRRFSNLIDGGLSRGTEEMMSKLITSETPVEQWLPKEQARLAQQILDNTEDPKDARLAWENKLLLAHLYDLPLEKVMALEPGLIKKLYGPSLSTGIANSKLKEDVGLLKRFVKGLFRGTVVEPGRTLISEGPLGDIDTTIEMVRAMKEKDEGPSEVTPGKPRKFSIMELLGLVKESNKLAAEAKAKTRQKVYETMPGKLFDVPKAANLPEVAVEAVAGVTAFMGRLAFTKKWFGIPQAKVVDGKRVMDIAGSAVTWEMENQAMGGTPGKGAAMRLALFGIDKIPAETLIGKSFKLGSESSLFGGLAYAAGGDWEEVATAAMIPLAFKAYNAAGTGFRRGRMNKAVKNLRVDLTKYGLAAEQVPDEALRTIINGSKEAARWNKSLKKGRITKKVHEQRMGEIGDNLRPIFEAIGRMSPVKPASEKPAGTASLQPGGQTKASPTPTVPVVKAKPLESKQDTVDKITGKAPKVKESVGQGDLVSKQGVADMPKADLEKWKAENESFKGTSQYDPEFSKFLDKKIEAAKGTEPVEPQAEPVIDLSEETRTKQIKSIDKEISDHPIYKLQLESIKEQNAKILDNVGVIWVPERYRKQVEDVIGKRKGFPTAVQKMFTFDPEAGSTARHWDEVVMSIVGADEGVIDTQEAFDIDTLVQMVTDAVEANRQGKSGHVQVALDKAIASGDPYLQILAMKKEMLLSGFSAAEINDNIIMQSEFFGVPEESYAEILVPIEEVKDDGSKQEVSDRVASKDKPTKREPDYRSRALQKAKARSRREKRPIYIFEKSGSKAGLFGVTSNTPRGMSYTKVEAPRPGQIESIITEVYGRAKQELTPYEQEMTDELVSRIEESFKKKGMSKKLFEEIKKQHGGQGQLVGKKNTMTVAQLGRVLKAVQKVRPKQIGHLKVITQKTEDQIRQLKENLIKANRMTKDAFASILYKETRGKEPVYTSATKFITQSEGRAVLNRMHDMAEIIGITEPARKAVEKNAPIRGQVERIEAEEQKYLEAKDPTRLKSMRYYFQKLGYQSGQPIYEVYKALTNQHKEMSRDRHERMKYLESLPGFTEIATSEEALKRVNDYIASQSYQKDKPKVPALITENEIKLAGEIQKILKDYEPKARLGKFLQHINDLPGMPQYFGHRKSIDKALDVYNSQGFDALTEYLILPSWGIISSGYSPTESVTFKTSTHDVPDIAVGRSHVKIKGLEYRASDRNILQILESYMRQMDMIALLQPKIKALIRLMDDSYEQFRDPRKVVDTVSTFVSNIKHTNSEGGLIEEVMRKVYSQAITVRVLADPLKPGRNLGQNTAFSEDRRDFLRLLAKLARGEKLLNDEDAEYLNTFVQQDKVMLSDWAFVGEEPFDLPCIGQFRFGIDKLTKWVQRKTLYPASDRLNRLISFTAKRDRVHRAFESWNDKTTDSELKEMMKEARFSDMQWAEQKMALRLLAKDGPDVMARYVAGVHTDNTHFLYAIEDRSPAEQTKVGKVMLNLALFKRAATEKAVLQLQKTVRGGSPADKVRAAKVLVTLIGMSALVNVLWKKITGKKYGAYDYISFLEINSGGLELASIQKIEDVYNNMIGAATGDDRALAALTTAIPASADYLIPFYDLGLRAIEATLEAKNLDSKMLRRVREMIDKEYRLKGSAYKMDRSLVEKFQYTLGGSGIDQKDKKPKAANYKRE